MKIEFTEEQLQIIIQGLAMLPYRDSAQLITYVHMQFNPPPKKEEEEEDVNIAGTG